MPAGKSKRKQASVQTELMTIEVRTSSVAEMRLMGSFSVDMLRTILCNVMVRDSQRAISISLFSFISSSLIFSTQ